jgi:hypothetical protein
MESRNVTANTLEELNKKVQEMVEQGWHADGAVIENKDGTFTQKMVK